MKKLFLLLTSTTLMFSCKNDNNEKQGSSELEKKEVKNYFYADVEVQASKKDDFAMYYTEDGTVNFTGDKAEWAGTKGDNNKETISFKLREDKFPTNLRFDFGINKEQDTVKVYEIKLGYQDRDFIIHGAEFFKYFINNEKDFSASIDQKNGALKIVKKDATYNTPYFYPTEELNKKIKEITTGKP